MRADDDDQRQMMGADDAKILPGGESLETVADRTDVEAIRRAIEGPGFFVSPDLVPQENITAMRNFWLAEFARSHRPAPIVWGPYLGEPNNVLYDETPTLSLYRSFDYLWNSPFDALTRRVALDLNRARNRIVEQDDRCGELMTEDRYGIYVTTSLYPCGRGWMQLHPDTARDRRHWHFILPLTFRGEHFTEGGLMLRDRGGKTVDIDALVTPGSVVFYDGTLEHGVDRIGGAPGKDSGRLQMFAIPTFFELPIENDRLAGALPLRRVVRARLSRLKARLTRGLKAP
jgi:hypothetical protein